MTARSTIQLSWMLLTLAVTVRMIAHAQITKLRCTQCRSRAVHSLLSAQSPQFLKLAVVCDSAEELGKQLRRRYQRQQQLQGTAAPCRPGSDGSIRLRVFLRVSPPRHSLHWC